MSQRYKFISLSLAVAIVAAAGIYGGYSLFGRHKSAIAESTTTVAGTKQDNAIGSMPQPLAPNEFRIGKNGRPLFITARVGGRSIRMLIDTGCARTVLDNSFRSSLGNTVGKVDQKTFAGMTQVDLFDAPEVDIAGVQIKLDQPISCQDMSELRKYTGEEFYGVIGMDIMRKFVIQFDFDQGILRWTDSVSTPLDEKNVPLRINYERAGCPSVIAKCGSIEHLFIVDTGSSNTCVDESTYAQLVSNGELDAGLAYRAMSATGSTDSRSGLLRTLEVGPFTHEELLCDKDSMSVLGLGYLSRYIVTFDFPNDTLYLCEGRRFSKVDSRGVSGLSPIRSQNGFLVNRVAPSGPAEIAGIQVGDEIRNINGESTVNMDMFRMGELLRSSPGQELRIKVVRNEQEFDKVIIVNDRFAPFVATKPDAEESIYR